MNDEPKKDDEKIKNIDHSTMHHSNYEHDRPMHDMTGIEHNHDKMAADHETHAGHEMNKKEMGMGGHADHNMSTARTWTTPATSRCSGASSGYR
jgi:uncharacterized protein involved in copper resistance